MIDRSKVALALEHVAHSLFTQQRQIEFLTAEIWCRLVDDPNFIERIEDRKGKDHLASWQGSLGDVASVTNISHNYAVCAVDGSQIYPERHLEGTECFLINSAGCILRYGTPSSAKFFSEPYVYVPQQFADLPIAFSSDIVDLVREEHEFALMVDQASLFTSTSTEPFVALFDGNLLFWHLESKPATIQSIFLKKYCTSLDVLYQKRIPVAGYLSSSRFSDIVQLFSVGMQEGLAKEILGVEQWRIFTQALASMTDVELLTHVLEPGQRTTVFKSNLPLVERYPEYLRPHFLYLNSGAEIVRLEIPAWIAQDNAMIELICGVCIDQCVKGYGYPISLAEAHAQAVVKSADRDFFYHLIHTMAIEQNRRVFLSQKSLKKRIIGF